MNPHGEYSIKVVDRCLKVKAEGSWNLEAMEEYIYDFKEKARPLANSHWGVILDITEWKLGTPDTEQIVDELQHWCMENNQKYEAIVCDENEVKKTQMNRYLSKIYPGHIKYKYFLTISDAIEWFSNLKLINA